ncbi:MAG: rhodanese-like domain-containing protein [Verrucomicrobia bacterium]|nr:rhodanese-like domain-containing protein [Verrucomicrobiota bacterium]
MDIKLAYVTTSLSTLLVLSSISTGFSQAGGPPTQNDYKDPEALATTLRDEKAAKPVIFNIGSVRQIKGAILIGPGGKAKNLDKLKQELAKLPKDKEIVIYCGCCPLQRCPNMQPAFALLKQMKFTNAKMLKLLTNLEDDWTSKGYPME